MGEIKHRVGIKGSAADIYQLLTTDEGLSQWWTSDTRGAGLVGSVIHFYFGDTCVDFEVVELQENRLVRWHHSGEMPTAWMGSKINFELEEQEIQTILLFSHYDWKKSDDFLAHCSTKWVVLYPCDNYEFSVPVVIRSKAPYEANGYSIGKYCNGRGGSPQGRPTG